MKKFVMVAALVAGFTVAGSASALNNYPGYLLKKGVKGPNAHVMTLQNCLMGEGFANAGGADGYFGNLTAAQVTTYQIAEGLKVDGIVGPQTWADLDCQPNDSSEVEEEEKEEVVEKEFTLGGEGDITDFDIKAEEDAEAATRDEHVATIEFEVEDGDVQLEKVELFFEEDDTDDVNSNDVWENIENIKLVVDGDEIADIDVSDDDDWKEHDDPHTSGQDVFSISLKGDVVFEEDEEVEIEVLIDTTDEVETGNSDEDYSIWAELRFVNGEGVTLWEGEDENDDSDEVEFAIEALSAFELDFDEANDSPEDDDSLDLSEDLEQTMVIVDVEVEDKQDGTLEDASVTLAIDNFSETSAPVEDLEDLIDEVMFLIDGKEIDSDDNADVNTLATGDKVYTFDLDDYEVEKEDEFEIEVVVKFNEIDDDSDLVGTTVRVKEITIDGENQEGDNFTQESETTSYAPTFVATAGEVEIDFNDDLELLYTSDHAGTAKFEVSIKNNTGADITDMDVLANWILDVDGLTVASNNPTAVTDEDENTLDADAEVIEDGETETYTVSIAFTGDSNQDASIEIERIGAENIAVSETVSE